MKKMLLALLLFICSSRPAGAVGNKEAEVVGFTTTQSSTSFQVKQERQMAHMQSLAAKMPKVWLSCNASEDCGNSIYNPSEVPFSANKKYLGDVQTVICQTEHCYWPKTVKHAGGEGRYFAVCEQEQCKTIVVDPYLYACSQNSDCELIHYDCNQEIDVNANHLSEVKEKFCKHHGCAATDCTSFNDPNCRGDVCMNGECTGLCR